jgi:hypothetical protein
MIVALLKQNLLVLFCGLFVNIHMSNESIWKYVSLFGMKMKKIGLLRNQLNYEVED